tara:strand:+ start:1303 stop:1647 length:345 start_codon:yes stop_codon:yes gene_type:complete
MGRGTINDVFRKAKLAGPLVAIALSGCASATDPTVPLYDPTGKTPQQIASDERFCTQYARDHVGSEFRKNIVDDLSSPESLVGLPLGIYTGPAGKSSQTIFNRLYTECGKEREK